MRESRPIRPRPTSTRWRPLVLATLLLACHVPAGCDDHKADVAPLIAAGQRQYQPVIDALEAYRRQHRAYPEHLDDLVAAGLLDAEPAEPPPAQVARSLGGPAYQRLAGGRRFTLTFWYHLKDQGFGLGDTTYAEWDSDKRQWEMTGPGYP